MSSYLLTSKRKLFNATNKTIKRIVDSGVEFDAVAFRGVSGALVAPAVAHALKKNIIVVRKKGTPSHSDNTIEGKRNQKYIIVDDFVAYGRTVDAITKKLGTKNLRGIFMYNQKLKNNLSRMEHYHVPVAA